MAQDGQPVFLIKNSKIYCVGVHACAGQKQEKIMIRLSFLLVIILSWTVGATDQFEEGAIGWSKQYIQQKYEKKKSSNGLIFMDTINLLKRCRKQFPSQESL